MNASEEEVKNRVISKRYNLKIMKGG